MKRLLLLLFAIVATMTYFAPSSARAYAGLYLRAHPLYIETNQLASTAFGLGAEAIWFPHKRILVSGNFDKSTFSNSIAGDYEDIKGFKASPALKPFTYWQAGAQINLFIKQGTFRNTYKNYKQVGYDYNYSTGTSTTTYEVTSHDIYQQEIRMIGVRGGIFREESGIDAEEGKDADTIRYSDGAMVTDRLNTFSNHSMSGYYFGIGYTRVFYEIGLWRNLYVDVLVCNKMEFHDADLMGFSKRKVGARLGLEGARRIVGGRLEGGIRPGIDGFYLLTQFTLGIMI